ncbi:MAG: hypothetical protein ACKVPX_01885 [Myxococcaceae bacterium]
MVRQVVGLWALSLACGLGCAHSGIRRLSPAEVETMQTEAVAALVKAHGESQRARIERGVRQVSALWQPDDGDFGAFVQKQFLPEGPKLDEAFAHLETLFEQLEGHSLEMSRATRWHLDVDTGGVLPIDELVGGLDPSAHLSEDLFRSKVGFFVLLNFPMTTLDERILMGPTYSREQWARVRLAGRFAKRIPPGLIQKVTEVASAADLYISGYNVFAHHVLEENGQRRFPKGKRLISHWNLRDEIKASYADPDGLPKQRLLVQVMERIVSQEIPAGVVNNPRLDWNPNTQRVTEAPADTVEEGTPPATAGAVATAFEPDTRYEFLLKQFRAAKAVDAFTPTAPNAVLRAFEVAELPEERVTKLLTDVLESPVVEQVAQEISKRLGRPLEPHDLWFNGFSARGSVSEDALSQKTRVRYPNAEAFTQDMPRLLRQLGFAAHRAEEIASRIRVDNARGAGHAMPAARRGDSPRLRTRIEADGMEFKGYNVAIHELGHNVEQVISLYDVDHTLLSGVPNTAFTEALAFVFQARDLELLGEAPPDAEAQRLKVLNDFWQTWEIAGVALVDISVWKWMYAHPDATPQALKAAVLTISKDVWNRYCAKVLGGRDRLLLGVYSHMISYPLYLFNYPLGHLIAFQLEAYLKSLQDAPLGVEIDRIARTGSVTPDVWMKEATGDAVSAAPLLEATAKALAGEK